VAPDALKALRARLGLSQEQFARRYHFAAWNIRNWEQGRRIPDPGSALLLALIDMHPEHMALLIAKLPEE
jgi:putative transcriptional regulator